MKKADTNKILYAQSYNLLYDFLENSIHFSAT